MLAVIKSSRARQKSVIKIPIADDPFGGGGFVGAAYVYVFGAYFGSNYMTDDQYFDTDYFS